MCVYLYVCICGCVGVVWCGVVWGIVGGGVVCGVTSDVNQFQMPPTPGWGCVRATCEGSRRALSWPRPCPSAETPKP